jgi:hypothetical protein
MKVGDLIYDSDYKLLGLVFGKDGCFFRVLYEDGDIDPAADPGKYDVKVISRCAKDEA